jgi:short chain dehydrogenase
MISIDLTGRTALVTGASGGVWSAVAERFAEAGATVVVHRGRDANGARRVAGRLERITDVAVVSADLTDEGAVTRLFDPSGAGPLSVRCPYRDPGPQPHGDLRHGDGRGVERPGSGPGDHRALPMPPTEPGTTRRSPPTG